MSQTSTLKGQCIAEFLGTGLLIFFGVGCVAALKVAGASFGQWEISVIWGLGVAMAIYLTAGVSGAHLNPAVTIALWLFACFDKRKVIPFIVSQVAGGRDIPYFLVPLFGPIVGAIVGAFAYRKLIGRHLPCDICVVEEKETTTPSEQKASL
ncbi:TPA: aquaporin [Escherichia coli]|nr:aquaporin [Escherichia coli]